jgi:hypothetical protein
MLRKGTKHAALVVAVLGLGLLGALPAAASAPQPVRVEMTGAFTGPSTVAGTYSSSGAVEDSGTYVETFRFAGASIHGVKTLTGNAGTVTLIADAVIRWTSPTTAVLFAGHWRFVGGTGAYQDIQGGGSPAVIGSADLAAGTVDVVHEGWVSSP